MDLYIRSTSEQDSIDNEEILLDRIVRDSKCLVHRNLSKHN